MFSTHVDCVPPYVPLSEDAESIHGRGSCDAKGLAAAMVAAAERLASAGERRIGLLFLVGGGATSMKRSPVFFAATAMHRLC